MGLGARVRPVWELALTPAGAVEPRVTLVGARVGYAARWLGWRGVVPVAVKRERVDGDRVADEVEELAVVADAVGAAEPAAVVEVPVDGFGVVAAGKGVGSRGRWAGWLGGARRG